MKLIDEHSNPPLRTILGGCLRTATTADIAIRKLRLAGLDLSASETGRLRLCRILVGEFDAAMLGDVAAGSASVSGQLALLAGFARSGRLQMRTAPHHIWNPDFSIFSDLAGAEGLALLGAHYFGRPYPLFGLVFTLATRDADHIALCRQRFEEIWQAGYDVLPAVVDTLEHLQQ